MRRLRAIALAMIAALGACDDSEPTPYVPAYDPNDVQPIPEIELCPMLAQNVCATLRPCCAPSPFAFDEAKCRAVVRASCEAVKAHSHDQSLVYDDVLAGRCAEGFGALVTPSCAVDGSFTDPRLADPRAAAVAFACAAMWHGATRLGGVCSKTEDCVQLDLQAVICGGFPTVCRALRTLRGGDPCGFTADPSCNSGLCACGAGLTCTGTPPAAPVCTATRLPDGAQCTVDAACEADRRCACPLDSTACVTRVCEPLPGAGESCWFGDDHKVHCAFGFRCDQSKGASTCIAGKTIGATCGSDDECASGRCKGVCIPGGIVDAATCSGVFDQAGPFGFLAPPASAATSTGAQ